MLSPVLPSGPALPSQVPLGISLPLITLACPCPAQVHSSSPVNRVLRSVFQVSIVDSGVRGTIAVGLVPQYYSLDHQPGWLPDSVAYHADDGK